jgi:hypothetical protein
VKGQKGGRLYRKIYAIDDFLNAVSCK